MLIGALCASLALAGCGSSSSPGTDAYPASVIPAGARLLLSAVVRPRGTLRTDALALGGALTHREDPYASLVSLLQTPGSAHLRYGRDVAGWLGSRACIFVLGGGSQDERLASLLARALRLGGGFPFAAGLEGAIVMDTSNATAAQSFLNAQASRAGARRAGYRGVAYRASASGVAFALVDRFAVIGSTAAVRAVIATARGGGPSAASAANPALRSEPAKNELAQLYMAPSRTAASARGGLSGLAAMLAATQATKISLVPGSGAVTLDADEQGEGGAGLETDLFTAGQAARTLGELPGESWLAAGLGEGAGELGAETGAFSAALHALGAGASGGTLSLGSLFGALLAPVQVLASGGPSSAWIGPVGVFAEGTGLLELKGAVVIGSREARQSRSAVAALTAQMRARGAHTARLTLPGTEAAASLRLPGLPIEMVIAAGRDAAGEARFVLGLGRASVAAALRPPSTLLHAASYSAARAMLSEGIEPFLILQVPTMLGLLESVGLAGGGQLPTLLPYARGLGTVAAGRQSLKGGIRRLRLVAALR